MTDVPSTLDTWNGSAEAELAKLVESARGTGRLTQHDLVRAFEDIEMTPDVLDEIYRRCRAAGIEIEETRDLDLDDAAAPTEVAGADLVVEDGDDLSVVTLSPEAARNRAAHVRRRSATLRRRTRINAAHEF